MQIIIYDPVATRLNLLPITYTRPIGAIRTGLFTFRERWEMFLEGDYYWKTESYLQELYPAPKAGDPDALYVAGNVVATPALAAAARLLRRGERLISGDRELVRKGNPAVADVTFEGEVTAVDQLYHIFGFNGATLRSDIAHITVGRKSAPVDSSNLIIGDPSLVFIEDGATVIGATLNTLNGPIYVGGRAQVNEGSKLRGPIGLCEHSVVNMGTLMYPDTTLGPWCKVGGELNNVVMLGYSNKAHDGFLGNAVIGEWCNLGAGTTASNLKNDYSEIKLWNYPAHRFLRTGLQFCGLIMGDHSKSAINTSFNTATVIGVGCNIVSEGMPRVFIPSFLKGGTAGFDEVSMSDFFSVATRVMARRGVELTEAYRRMCEAVADYSDRYK